MASTAMAGTIWFWNEAGAAAATSLTPRRAAWRMLVHLVLPLL